MYRPHRLWKTAGDIPTHTHTGSRGTGHYWSANGTDLYDNQQLSVGGPEMRSRGNFEWLRLRRRVKCPGGSGSGSGRNTPAPALHLIDEDIFYIVTFSYSRREYLVLKIWSLCNIISYLSDGKMLSEKQSHFVSLASPSEAQSGPRARPKFRSGGLFARL